MEASKTTHNQLMKLKYLHVYAKPFQKPNQKQSLSFENAIASWFNTFQTYD